MDADIVLFLNNNLRCGFLDMTMKFVSFLSNAGWIWITAAVLMLISRRYRRYGVALSVGLVLCLVFGNILLKPLVGRLRPYEVLEGITLLVDPLSDASFPSGHTFTAFCGAAVLLFANKRIGIPALALAFLTGFSRIYLGVHYLSDIVAGIALGIFAGAAGLIISKKIYPMISKSRQRI